MIAVKNEMNEMVASVVLHCFDSCTVVKLRDADGEEIRHWEVSGNDELGALMDLSGEILAAITEKKPIDPNLWLWMGGLNESQD